MVCACCFCVVGGGTTFAEGKQPLSVSIEARQHHVMMVVVIVASLM